MKFSEEIRQSSFHTDYEMAVLNIMYTSNWLSTSLDKVFKKHSILKQHFNVMRIVNGQHPKPCSPGYIIDVMLDKGRDLTRLIDKMVKLGYLTRTTRPDNRRMVDIHITEAGIEMTIQLKKEIEEVLMALCNIKEEEALTLSNLLDKVRG